MPFVDTLMFLLLLLRLLLLLCRLRRSCCGCSSCCCCSRSTNSTRNPSYTTTGGMRRLRGTAWGGRSWWWGAASSGQSCWHARGASGSSACRCAHRPPLRCGRCRRLEHRRVPCSRPRRAWQPRRRSPKRSHRRRLRSLLPHLLLRRCERRRLADCRRSLLPRSCRLLRLRRGEPRCHDPVARTKPERRQILRGHPRPHGARRHERAVLRGRPQGADRAGARGHNHPGPQRHAPRDCPGPRQLPEGRREVGCGAPRSEVHVLGGRTARTGVGGVRSGARAQLEAGRGPAAGGARLPDWVRRGVFAILPPAQPRGHGGRLGVEDVHVQQVPK